MKVIPLPSALAAMAQAARATRPDDEGAALRNIDLTAFRLDALASGEPPPRPMMLAPLFPLGTVSLLFGAGGLGKSLVALDLALGVAHRAIAPAGILDFFAGPLGGTIPREAAGASVFLSLEDDAGEMHRRVANLDAGGRRAGAPCFVIPGSAVPNLDPALVTTDRRAHRLTDLASSGLDDLLDRIERASGHSVRLLVLDPAGDFLDADENDAAPAKMLMRHLRGMAQRRRISILLLGHVAKAADGLPPTMRGSGAFMANSRAAYGLWRPDPRDMARLTKATGAPAEALVWGGLLKANHGGAPINRHRLFQRQADGRLLDVTDRLSRQPGMVDDDLIPAFVKIIVAAAAVGAPFAATGANGVYAGRADLPEPLSTLSRSRLEGLTTAAMERGLLVKAAWRGSIRQWLDAPSGALATGQPIEPASGSRAVAIRRAGGTE